MDDIRDSDKATLLMAAFRVSPDIAILSEMESGRFVEVNDSFVALTGFTREEVINRNSDELDLWEDRAEREAFETLLARDGQVRGFEARGRTKWSGPRKYQISAAITELDGVKYMISTLRDIQDRIEAEEQLRKGAFLLERAEEMARIGSWEFDYATKKVTGSAGAARIYGVRPQDMTVRTIEEVPLPEYRAILDEARDRHILRGEPYDIRFKIKRKEDGAVLDIHSRALWNPASKRLFGIIRDITEEKSVEEGLRQALAQRDALINELYHRTANTLQIILSMFKLEESAGDSRQTVQLVERMSRRVEAIALVHESLYEARNLSIVDLERYIPRLVESMRQARGGRADLAFEYALESVQILVDAAVPCGIIIEELVDNVFAHAFPSTPGRARISASRDASGRVHIAVRDEGAGGRTPPVISARPRLGLLLVKTLGEGQLKGSVRYGGPPGFSCELEFSDDFMSARV